jgi:hypothetical protein
MSDSIAVGILAAASSLAGVALTQALSTWRERRLERLRSARDIYSQFLGRVFAAELTSTRAERDPILREILNLWGAIQLQSSQEVCDAARRCFDSISQPGDLDCATINKRQNEFVQTVRAELGTLRS